MLPKNIACAFQNKVSSIKLEVKHECSYYLIKVREENQEFTSNLTT